MLRWSTFLNSTIIIKGSDNSTAFFSVSYCGKSGLEYPDKKPMGFPFDKPFNVKDINNFAESIPNRFVNNKPFLKMENIITMILLLG